MNKQILAAIVAALNTPAVLQAVNEALGGALEVHNIEHLNGSDKTAPLAVASFRRDGFSIETILINR